MAQTASSACQWFGVAITTASTSFRSITFRGSVVVKGSWLFLLEFSTCAAKPLRVHIAQGGDAHARKSRKVPDMVRPLLPRPITASRISSLAPRIRDRGRTAPAAVSVESFRNDRRVNNEVWFIVLILLRLVCCLLIGVTAFIARDWFHKRKSWRALSRRMRFWSLAGRFRLRSPSRINWGSTQGWSLA